jgi:hypothetical protein
VMRELGDPCRKECVKDCEHEDRSGDYIERFGCCARGELREQAVSS